MNIFPRLGDAEAILAVFGAYGKSQKTFDVTVKVNGGGVSGQTGSVELGRCPCIDQNHS